jgi:hypothetical protein
MGIFFAVPRELKKWLTSTVFDDSWWLRADSDAARRRESRDRIWATRDDCVSVDTRRYVAEIRLSPFHVRWVPLVIGQDESIVRSRCCAVV